MTLRSFVLVSNIHNDPRLQYRYRVDGELQYHVASYTIRTHILLGFEDNAVSALIPCISHVSRSRGVT